MIGSAGGMVEPVTVRIFGVPTVCGEGGKTWRDVADWACRQLTTHFGQQVIVEYYDLFSSNEAAAFPAVLDGVRKGESSPPLVYLGDTLLSAEGKVSIPLIRRRLEDLGLRPG